MRDRLDGQALVLSLQKTPDAGLYGARMSAKFHADFHGSDDKSRRLTPEHRFWTKPVEQDGSIGDKPHTLV